MTRTNSTERGTGGARRAARLRLVRVPRLGSGGLDLAEFVVLLVLLALVLQWGVAWVVSVLFPPDEVMPWDKVSPAGPPPEEAPAVRCRNAAGNRAMGLVAGGISATA